MPEPSYYVVVNAEEQHSIWPAHKVVPAGWTCVGEPTSREDALDRIDTIWTDIRPLSLRRATG